VEYKNISLKQAMKEVVWGSFAPGDGGFVGVDCNYNCIMDFNSVGMYRGCVDHNGRFETAVFPEGFEEAEAEKA
jgi:beta-aspartyl-peptidase (threonine type)